MSENIDNSQNKFQNKTKTGGGYKPYKKDYNQHKNQQHRNPNQENLNQKSPNQQNLTQQPTDSGQAKSDQTKAPEIQIPKKEHTNHEKRFPREKIKVEETADDIRKDLQRIEKEIDLEIKEITSMRLGL
ncbi:MAG: hypothetical protein LBI03_00840 [Clostridiales bacterium]|jgi:hypothetical protein|nr:hypothetical protein [Clostridiales bacterium]